MRKHSLLTPFLILIIIGSLFFLIMFTLSHFSDRYSYLLGGDKVGVVKIEGTIVESEPTIEQMVRFRKSKGIKAIVLRINSEGGMVAPSQEIYREVRKTCREKKVVASLESIAASGGYYIACAADKIVANPGTIVGSIGVILQLANIEELLKKMGLKSKIIKSGKYKDIGSMTRTMTGEEELLLQEFTDDIYDQFVDAVAEGRGLTREEVLKVADGRIFTGAQALKLGLIDSVGNFQDAVSLAGKEAGIEGEPKVVYAEKKRLSLLDYFWEKVSLSLIHAIERLIYKRGAVYF